MQNLNKPRPNKSLIFGSINVGWFFVKQGHGSCLVVLNDYNQVSFECIRLSLVGYIFNNGIYTYCLHWQCYYYLLLLLGPFIIFFVATCFFFLLILFFLPARKLCFPFQMLVIIKLLLSFSWLYIHSCWMSQPSSSFWHYI